MPGLSPLIEGCAYHPEGETMGFPFEGMPVVFEKRRVTVFGADTEAKAKRVLDWLDQKVAELGDPAKQRQKNADR